MIFQIESSCSFWAGWTHSIPGDELIPNSTSRAAGLLSSDQRLRARRPLHTNSAHQMRSLLAMSWRRRSSRVPLTSSSVTACDLLSSSQSATSRRSASHRRCHGFFSRMRASSSSRSPRSRCTDTSVTWDIATSVSLPLVAQNRQYSSGTSMRQRRAMRIGPLSTRNSSIDVTANSADEHSRVTQRTTRVSRCLRSAGAAPRATRLRCGSVQSASRRTSRPAPFPANTRVVCPSRSCDTHSECMAQCRVGLCTRRAGRRRCRALESLAPLGSRNPRRTARRAPSCSSFHICRESSRRLWRATASGCVARTPGVALYLSDDWEQLVAIGPTLRIAQCPRDDLLLIIGIF